MDAVESDRKVTLQFWKMTLGKLGSRDPRK